MSASIHRFTAAGTATALAHLTNWTNGRSKRGGLRQNAVHCEGASTTTSSSTSDHDTFERRHSNGPAAAKKVASFWRASGAGAKDVFRIAVTGGPCAGKSSALARLREELENRNYRVFTVPEACTILVANGFRFSDHDVQEGSVVRFQAHVARVQMRLEDTMVALAEGCGENAVVLTDRGLMDGRAYCSADEWTLVTESELSMTTHQLRDRRYEAVIHLVTAARGAEKFYSLQQAEGGTDVRHESAEEARALCSRTLAAWEGHEHLYIVDNEAEGGFGGKMKRAVNRVLTVVGEPVPGACLRKFAVEHMTAEELTKRASDYDVSVQLFNTETTYVNRCQRIRMRQAVDGDGASYFLQAFGRGAGIGIIGGENHVEKASSASSVSATSASGESSDCDQYYAPPSMSERQIDARTYYGFLKTARKKGATTVRKQLAVFLYEGFYYELNIFTLPEPMCILEVEAESSTARVPMPPFLRGESRSTVAWWQLFGSRGATQRAGSMLREVTHDANYDSYNVARKLAERRAAKAA